MLPDHADLASATHALDKALVRHANAGEVDQLEVAFYAEAAQGYPQTSRWFTVAAKSAS